MIVNRHTLLEAAPIKNMLPEKLPSRGTSYGMSEAGYDIRIKQEIRFKKFLGLFPVHKVGNGSWSFGRFTLASAIEEFNMPKTMVGIVHDKSSWARRGLSVFNTVIEPGWKGFLTLELVHHGKGELTIKAGAGIAQVVFHGTTDEASYEGKYQNQENQPVEAKESK